MGDAGSRRVPPRRGPAHWGPDGDRLLADVQARTARLGPLTLERQALRIRSYEMRHLLAARATAGARGYDALVAQLRTAGPSSRRRGLPRLVPAWTYALARTVGLQLLEPDDETVAARLLAALDAQGGLGGLDAEQLHFTAQVLFVAGEHDAARRVIRRIRKLPPAQRVPDWELEADSALAGPHPDERTWAATVQHRFAEAGVEPVLIGPDGPTRFDRLVCTAPTASVSGPLVSVLLTCYRPGPELLFSARSILGQTWADLELVVVDDASGPEFDAVLAECAGLDPRVRIVRQPENGGTYLARNAGLDAARGEYVTGQDDDDWSHPRRVELQIAPLLADPALRGTRSQCFRVSEDLRFTRPGHRPASANGSSLMFRRTPALAAAGYFDSVRKGADTEYLLRLTDGQPETVRDLAAPLAFVRVTDTTLSSGEFTVGWLAESRRDYRLQYRHWHAQRVPGTPLPRNPAARAFPAPADFCRRVPGAPPVPEGYDVVVLGECQSRGGPSAALLDEVHALVAAGLRVGVAHVEPVGPAPESGRATLPDLMELAAAGVVDLVQLDCGARVELLLVRSVAALPFLPGVPADLDVRRAVLAADEPPAGPGGLRYAVAACEQAIRDRFGVTPTWIPVDPRVRAGLESVVEPGRLEAHDLGGAVDPGRAVLPRPARRGSRAVLGWNPDVAGVWPAPADLFACYPSDDEFDVRIRGGAGSLTRVAGRVPPSWVVFDPDEIAPQAFLRALDFYVHATETVDAPTGRSVLEAVAAGALAVVHPALEPLFGTVAEYAAPGEVRATLRSWTADPVRLAARIAEAKVALLDRFGPSAYVAAARRLLEPART